MEYRIGVIGHIKNILLLEETINIYYKNIQLTYFEFNSIHQINDTLNYINAQAKYLDGILFTGKIPYELLIDSINLSLPLVYIKHDKSTLERALLRASLMGNLNVNSLSIDSYSKNTIIETYEEFGVLENQLNLHVYPMDIYNRNLLEDITFYHTENIHNHHVSMCITGIASVYEVLTHRKIPCILLKPSTDTMRHAIDHLILKVNSINNTDSQIVIISIEIDMPNEFHLLNDNEYQLMLEKTRVTQEVYHFAQSIQAAVVETGIHNYMLFSTKKIIESETNELQTLPILGKVAATTSHTLSIGIGYGNTAMDAKRNAAKGLNKALLAHGNQANIVIDSKITKTIYPETLASKESGSINDSIFQLISDNTGISINTIYRLYCIKEKSNKDYFTSKELANAFDITLRSMNRILKKLEAKGYIHVDGTRMMTDSGRPSRILKLLFYPK